MCHKGSFHCMPCQWWGWMGNSVGGGEGQSHRVSWGERAQMKGRALDMVFNSKSSAVVAVPATKHWIELQFMFVIRQEQRSRRVTVRPWRNIRSSSSWFKLPVVVPVCRFNWNQNKILRVLTPFNNKSYHSKGRNIEKVWKVQRESEDGSRKSN